MGNHFKKLIIFLLISLVHAENDLVKISHETRSVVLPIQGELVRIPAVIAGNNSFAQVRGIFNIDGNIIEAHSSIGKINSDEMMEYEFFIPAPKSYLIYKFYADSTDLNAKSNEYTLNRDCLQNLSYNENYTGSELIDNLRIKSKALEHQVRLTEQSLAFTEYLAKEIK